MKIKVRLIIQGVLLIISIVGLIISICFDNNYFIGILSGMLGASLFSFIRLNKISKSEKLTKEYTILEKDERVIYLNKEAKIVAYNILVLAFIITGIIGIIIDIDYLILIPAGYLLFSSVIYLVSLAIISKKK